MAKIKLGNAPKTIKHTVKAKGLDGQPIELTVHYKFRTRKEWGDMLDDLNQTNKLPEMTTQGETQEAIVYANAVYTLGILDSWELEDDLTVENLVKLGNEFPQIAKKITDDYTLAITEGRLGN